MYRIIIKKKAKKFIDKLPINEKKKIVYAIDLEKHKNKTVIPV